jgi:hypothetical protein
MYSKKKTLRQRLTNCGSVVILRPLFFQKIAKPFDAFSCQDVVNFTVTIPDFQIKRIFPIMSGLDKTDNLRHLLLQLFSKPINNSGHFFYPVVFPRKRKYHTARGLSTPIDKKSFVVYSLGNLLGGESDVEENLDLGGCCGPGRIFDLARCQKQKRINSAGGLIFVFHW